MCNDSKSSLFNSGHQWAIFVNWPQWRLQLYQPACVCDDNLCYWKKDIGMYQIAEGEDESGGEKLE